MFTLECMPKDADLFFEILDTRNSSLKPCFIRQEQKYHTTIVCTEASQPKLLTFRQIDIKDCVDIFSKFSNCLVYRVITQNPSLVMPQVAWLSEDLRLFVTHGAAFVKNVPFNWKQQHTRSLTKLLLDVTG